jgi:3-dehydroquinate synthase
MNKIKIPLGRRSYTIWIEEGLRERLPVLLKPITGTGRMLILSDRNIKSLYPSLFKALKAGSTEFFFIPPGEKSKSLETVERIVGFMLQKGFDRSTLLVALGGGVVGDIGGFAASLYMRGVPFVQVPTTLLSQVDSSVGGKTGVNHRLGKNMIGAFYQPKAVFIDTGFLRSLSKREFLSGFSEVVKHGIIRSPKLFAFLEKNLDAILSQTPGILDKIVAENCRIKGAVISKDEREKGLRAILNFGHTFGHAVESLTGYGAYAHGEAVLMGMKSATQTALELGLMDQSQARRVLSFLERLPFPRRLKLSPEAVYRKMLSDKKTRQGRLNLILPVRIGEVRRVPDPDKSAILRGIRAMVRPF